MVCLKCGYKDKKEIIKSNYSFCKVCGNFLPKDSSKLKAYASEKIDWEFLETFRKNNSYPGEKQREGMHIKSKKGQIVSRPPRGYRIIENGLEPNEDFSNISRFF